MMHAINVYNSFNIAHSPGFETLRSQIEMSVWEFFPGVLMLLFIGAGFSHFWTQHRRSRVYSQVQRDKRKNISIPIVINTPVTQEFSVNTCDISLSGAFLSYEDLQKSMVFTSLIGKRSGIKVGDLVDIKVFTGRFSQFSCQARVVRYNFDDQAVPPKGIGIEFINLSKKNRKALEHLIHAQDFSESA